MDTDVSSIRLDDKEVTTVQGGTTVTVIEDAEVDIVIQLKLLNSDAQEHFKALHCTQL